ncbi:hypothetical protein KIW84_035382, partial [Lathyrus oleraceus]
DKNLAENSDTLAHTDEPPMPDPNLNDDTDGEQPPPPPSEHEENQQKEEKKEETVENTESVDADDADVVESSPPSLEKVSEEIDQFLVGLYEKEAASVSFDIPDYVGKFLDLLEENLGKCDTGEGKAKWEEILEKDTWLLEAVNRISKLKKILTRHDENETVEDKNEKRDSTRNRIGVIQQKAMSFLEEDFRVLMEDSRMPMELSSDGQNIDSKGKQGASEEVESDHQLEESETNFPGYTDEAIACMSKIACEMLTGGYESECCQVYIVARRTAFEEIQQKLGLERISIDDMVQKVQWEILARDMIPAWTNTIRKCTTVYFPGERKLAEAVFSSNQSVAAGLFGSLSRGVVIPLLNFAEGAAMTKRAGEKLFKLLDMYETLRDVIPKLDGLFPEESSEELKTEITLAKTRLGEAAIAIFCDLENSIKSETVKNPVPGGAVHPLTRYIMNYLIIAGDYKETLEQVFRDHSKIECVDSSSRLDDNENHVVIEEASSPFSAQVMRVMDLLDASLDGKAKLYRDIALSNFFMMNNGRYILQKIKSSSEMSQVVGNTWCRKKSSDLRNYHKTYQRETWNKLLNCLSQEGLNVNGKVQKAVLKERFKSFSTLFDEIHRTQSLWVVKDEQLQSELRVSISAVVIPAYRAFFGRFSQNLDSGRQAEKYIKYQPEDIETYIDDLFDGKPPQSNARRKT